MCEPVTIGVLTAAATGSTTAGVIAGGAAGINAYAAYQGAKAERGQANFQAAIADNNAILADNAALDAQARGDAEAANVRRAGAKVAGQQRAAAASSGVDAMTGLAAQLRDETEYFSEADATTVRNNAARQAFGFRSEAQDYRSNASMQRAVAKSKSPGTAAGISLLGSATQTALAFA